MTTERRRLALFAVIALAWATPTVPCCSASAAMEDTATADRPEVRNIILFVADGWGYHHMEASSIYQFGRRDGQIYQDFPVHLAAATYMHGGDYDPQRAWADFDYFRRGATDSAAAATAMSTGRQTSSGRIGVCPDGERLTHLADHALRRGMAAGVVTSVPLGHATPAGFVAHNEDRGDRAGIGRQMIEESKLDLIMGTGHPLYDNDGRRLDEQDHDYSHVGGEDVWHRILAGEAGNSGGDRPWRFVETRQEFLELIDGEVEDRILGVPRVDRTLQYRRRGNGDTDPFVVPFIEGIPTLEEMTRGALNVLSQRGDGFFVMVEGGAIDWAGHGNNSPRLIEEHVDFDNAVRAAVEWVEANSSWDETLMIVTSDHECGYLLGPDSGPEASPMWQPIENRGKGEMPGHEWHSTGHTNKLVPFLVRGAAAERFEDYVIGTDPERGPYVHISAIGRLGKELLSGKEDASDDEAPASSGTATIEVGGGISR